MILAKKEKCGGYFLEWDLNGFLWVNTVIHSLTITFILREVLYNTNMFLGKDLLKLPVFEAAIKKCDAVLKPKGYDIFKIICDTDPDMFSNVIHSFIGIAAIQVILFKFII